MLGDRPGLECVASAADAAQGADAPRLVTEWKEFRTPDSDGLKTALKQPLVFDGRNIWDPALLGQRGFEVHGIGRVGG